MAHVGVQDETQLLALYQAVLTSGHELLLEVIPPRSLPCDGDTVVRALKRIYNIGIFPDWWKLEGQPSPAAWNAVERAVKEGDPYCRGVVLLGLEAPEEGLAQAFAVARHCGVVKGFAVGRTTFWDPLVDWRGGKIKREAAVAEIAKRFGEWVAIFAGAH